MSDAAKTKRPPRKSLRAGARHKDARAETLPPRRAPEAEVLGRVKPAPARARAAPDPDAELAHLRNALASEADQIAEMLVRLAQVERAKAVAEARVAELTASLSESKAARRRAEAETRAAAQRAEAAETWVDQVMGTLEQVQDGLDAGRARIQSLEKELARLRGGRASAPAKPTPDPGALAQKLAKLRQTRPPSRRTSLPDMPVLDVADGDILDDE